MQKINSKVIIIFSFFGLAGSMFYFLHVIFGRLFYEGYNPFAQAISDLTASDSPSKNIAALFSRLYGLFTVIFSIGLFICLKGKINRFITFAAGVFCAMTIVSFFGYTFFPLTEAGYAGTFRDQMHLLVTVLVVVLTIIAIILFCIGFFRTDQKYMGVISVCTFLLLLTGAMLINILPQEYFGVAERINVYSVVIYTGILSVWLYRNSKSVSC